MATRSSVQAWAWRVSLFGVFALALVLRCHVDESPIDGRTFPRHDENHYVELAQRVLNGELRVRWFINPTAYAYLLALVSVAIGGLRVLAGLDESFRDFVVRDAASPRRAARRPLDHGARGRRVRAGDRGDRRTARRADGGADRGARTRSRSDGRAALAPLRQ
jgi:hypothetical protein